MNLHQRLGLRPSDSKMQPSASEAPETEATSNAPVDDQSHVELQDVAPPKDILPIEGDIMQLARLGEVGAIQKLFDDGTFSIDYKDEEGITPLHVGYLWE